MCCGCSRDVEQLLMMAVQLDVIEKISDLVNIIETCCCCCCTRAEKAPATLTWKQWHTVEVEDEMPRCTSRDLNRFAK